MASSRVRAEVAGLLFAVVLGSAGQLAGQDKGDELQELIAAVEPSVVTIEVPGVGAGSGFVVDANGIVATNFHVIDGATRARVKFLDGRSADAAGFVAVSPGKDIALLKIKPVDNLVPLPVAQARASKGEAVFTFGAPKGLSGSVSDGIVSALRDGFEISSSMKEVYAAFRYDLDARWLQTTAPISNGNSGGPLVNKNGEAIGINTWFRTDGQNLNFAVSTVYVRRMLEDAGDSVHPFTELPNSKGIQVQSRQGVQQDAIRATRNYWAELAKSKRSGNRYDSGPFVGSTSHAFALRHHAERIKSFSTKGVDVSLVEIAILEAQNAERLDTAISERNAAAFASERELRVRINEAYDFLQISLSAKYGVEFPQVMSFEAQRGLPLSEAESAVIADEKLKTAKESLARGERESAVGQFSEIIARHPQTAVAKEAADLLGPAAVEFGRRVLEGTNKRQLKWLPNLLRDVIDKCPGTPAAKEAAELLERANYRIRSEQANGKLHLAKKLIEIGRSESAVGRLKVLIDEFPGTPAAKKAEALLKELKEAD